MEVKISYELKFYCVYGVGSPSFSWDMEIFFLPPALRDLRFVGTDFIIIIFRFFTFIIIY